MLDPVDRLSNPGHAEFVNGTQADAARGASTLMMEALADNHEMLALISDHFPAARYCHTGPHVTARVPLPLVQEEQPRESAGRAYGPHQARRERELAGLG
jgi:hypothetical protein